MRFGWFVVAVYLGCVPAGLRAQDTSDRQMAMLMREPAETRAQAAQELYDSLLIAGGPLVHPLPDHPGQSSVTFMWRGDAATESVAVITPRSLNDFAGSVMDLLPATEFWYRTLRLSNATRFAYRFEVNGPLEPFEAGPSVLARISTLRRDPLRGREFVYALGDTTSVLELSDAPDRSWSLSRAGARAGPVDRTVVRSLALGGERAMWIYRPPGYSDDDRPYPLLIVTDGETQLAERAITTTLDNLIQAGAIPPLVAVGVTSTNRGRDLGCSVPFGDFVTGELFSWLEAQGITIAGPREVAITGYSLGGLAAACAALRHPDQIGLVLSQSGSFQRPLPPEFEAEGVRRLVEGSPHSAVRFYLEVGLEEFGPMFGGNPNTLSANRGLSESLRARGYSVTYVERASGHDPVAWRETLHLGLVDLFGGR